MASIERTAYPRFRREPTARALQECYTPTEEDIGFAQSIIRSDEHLFCVVVQLKCFQQLGHFPDLAEVPAAVANHIRLRLRLPAGVPLRYDQPRTRYRHHDAIRSYLRITPSHDRPARRIAVRAIFDSAKVMDNPADLINVAVEQLRTNNCELMGFPSLDRLVQRIRAMTHRRLFRGVMERLALSDRERLDTLLKTTELVQRQSAFNSLKQLPKKPSLTHLKTLLDHLEWLESLGEIDAPLEGIPPALVTHFAAEAKTLNAGELKEYQELRRYTLLLCLIHMMRVRTRDDVAEMFLKRMGCIHQRARQKLLEIQARQRQKTENLAATLAEVLEIVPGEDDDSTKVTQMMRLLADRGGVEQLLEDCQAIQAWSDNNYIPLLAAPYRVHRHVLFRLIRMLHLESTNQGQSLMDALHIALQNESRRSEWVAAAAIDLSFASARWHKVVFRRKDDQLQMHRRQFEICVFSHLAIDLRAGDVGVAGSEAFADYRHQMVPWEDCAPLVPEYCAKLGLPDTAAGFVEKLRKELEEAAQSVDEGFPRNDAVKINKQGEPVVSRVHARPIPASALELEAAMHLNMPERAILEVLRNVEYWANFSRHFGPLSGADPKLEHPQERYLLTSFAIASGMGVTQAARHMGGLITEHVLAFINRRHVTAEKLERACREIIDLYSQIELARQWGSGKTAAVDGTLYEVYEQNLLADFHFRYGLKGAVAFHVVSDTYMILFTHFIPPGVWEAVYIIDALMRNQSVIQPDTIFGDTQSQSTPVFAFAHLLGIKLMPRIRHWKNLTFYRSDKQARYKHIDGLFQDTIDWDLIETHWRDLLQVAISIQAGKVSSAMLLRKLGNYSRRNKLYLAAQEVGRVDRTIYLLKWISDVPTRREVTAGTNKAEEYHGLAKWIRFGGEGVIAQNDPDEQQKRVRYVSLVAAAIMFQNVVDMTRAIKQLERDGFPVNREDVMFLSPYMTRKIKRFGEYALRMDETPRPLDEELGIPRKAPERAIQTLLPFLMPQEA